MSALLCPNVLVDWLASVPAGVLDVEDLELVFPLPPLSSPFVAISSVEVLAGNTSISVEDPSGPTVVSFVVTVPENIVVSFMPLNPVGKTKTGVGNPSAPIVIDVSIILPEYTVIVEIEDTIDVICIKLDAEEVTKLEPKPEDEAETSIIDEFWLDVDDPDIDDAGIEKLDAEDEAIGGSPPLCSGTGSVTKVIGKQLAGRLPLRAAKICCVSVVFKEQ
ncbi:hypothetical protein ABW20_dc0102930 [Dactylellina cionopaga]|nr:hypothetical protein ABW20_dc0102930 [Dactylellina cionopaga]